MTQAQQYIAGWRACMCGVDGRYVSQVGKTEDEKYAWMHGWLDAMEAEDGEHPQPASAGYAVADYLRHIES